MAQRKPAVPSLPPHSLPRRPWLPRARRLVPRRGCSDPNPRSPCAQRPDVVRLKETQHRPSAPTRRSGAPRAVHSMAGTAEAQGHARTGGPCTGRSRGCRQGGAGGPRDLRCGARTLVSWFLVQARPVDRRCPGERVGGTPFPESVSSPGRGTGQPPGERRSEGGLAPGPGTDLSPVTGSVLLRVSRSMTESSGTFRKNTLWRQNRRMVSWEPPPTPSPLESHGRVECPPLRTCCVSWAAPTASLPLSPPAATWGDAADGELGTVCGLSAGPGCLPGSRPTAGAGCTPRSQCPPGSWPPGGRPLPECGGECPRLPRVLPHEGAPGRGAGSPVAKSLAGKSQHRPPTLGSLTGSARWSVR